MLSTETKNKIKSVDTLRKKGYSTATALAEVGLAQSTYYNSKSAKTRKYRKTATTTSNTSSVAPSLPAFSSLKAFVITGSADEVASVLWKLNSYSNSL